MPSLKFLIEIFHITARILIYCAEIMKCNQMNSPPDSLHWTKHVKIANYPKTLDHIKCSFVYVGHLYYHIVLRYIVSNLNLLTFLKGGYSCHMIFMECCNGWYLVSCVWHFLKYCINNYGISPSGDHQK